MAQKGNPNILIIPERVRKRRKDKKLSQVEVGRRVGVSKQSVSHWEDRSKKPSIRRNNLDRLAKALSCEPDYLTGNTDQPNHFKEGGKEYGTFGLPLSLIPEIIERLELYDDEKLQFIYSFLSILDTYSPPQLELIKRIFVSISGVEIQKVTLRHPFNDWSLFRNIFFNVQDTLIKINKSIENISGCELPSEVNFAFDSCKESIKKDFMKLSYPLQNEDNFRRSLKHIPDSFDYLINSLDNLSVNDKQLELLKHMCESQLPFALDKDIKHFFLTINETTIF